jgi:hypothetical protein
LANALFDKRSVHLLELIILARDTTIRFNNCHRGMAGFGNIPAIDHASTFTKWAFALHLRTLNEVRYTVDPNSDELQTYTKSRH